MLSISVINKIKPKLIMKIKVVIFNIIIKKLKESFKLYMNIKIEITKKSKILNNCSLDFS